MDIIRETFFNFNMKTLVISDFSKTLTVPTSKTTWSLFKESGLFPEEYSKKRDALFEEYRPYEIAGDNEKVREWFQKHLELLAEYDAVSKIPEVIRISQEKGFLFPREGIGEFRSWYKKTGSELRIVSSGITELIGEFMGALRANGFVPKDTDTSSVLFVEITANSIARRQDATSISTPIDKFRRLSQNIIDTHEAIVVLGDAPEDFAIPEVEYSKDGKFRGFSFSDGEIVP